MFSEEMTNNQLPSQLMGAYLNGDVTPNERASVEKYLTEEPLARQHLEELRKLSLFLKTGDRQARAQAAEKLRSTVFKLIQLNKIQAAMAAGISGEASDKDAALMREHFKANPAAQQELQKLEAFSVTLKKAGEMTASNDLSAKFRARMSLALPDALGRSTTTGKAEFKQAKPSETAAHSPVRSPSERPSLRVFVKHESPWGKRVLALSGLAAVLALAAGVELWRRNSAAQNPPDVASGHPDKGIIETKPKDPVQPAPEAPNFAHVNESPVLPPVHQEVAPSHPNDPNVKVVEAPQNALTPVRPENAPKTEPVIIAEQNKNANPTTAPREVVKNSANNNVPSPTNNSTNNVAERNANTPANQVPSLNNSVTPNSIANQTSNGNGRPMPSGNNATATPTVGNTINNGVGPSVAANANATPITPNTNAGVNTQTTDPNNTLGATSKNPDPVATTGPATVGSLKGTGLARLTVNGLITELKRGDTIPSGALIETNESVHIGLTLPGGGRFYVNSNSKLTLTYAGKGISVELSAGEIYYGNVDGMSVTANKVSIEQATEADVVIAGKLRASNIGTKKLQMVVSGTKKQSESIATNMQGSVTPDGSDKITKEDIGAQTGYWRQDVMLDGDGLRTYKSGKVSKR